MKQKIVSVNVEGTRNVIAACKKVSVPNLIYTSSYNAVFTGKPFTNAKLVPYPADNEFVDDYSRSKSHAERLVIAADGPDFHCVSLRLSGIYGPGELRHFPRSINLIRHGLLLFVVGGTESLVEWAYIDNVVHAHLLAASKLWTKCHNICGRAFPISDQHPVNQFLFIKPLVEALGYQFPTLNIPLRFILPLAALGDFALVVLFPIVALEPFLTRLEVLKTAIEHTFDYDEVQQVLEYRPIVDPDDGMKRTVAFFVDWSRANPQKFSLFAIMKKVFTVLVVGISALFIVRLLHILLA